MIHQVSATSVVHGEIDLELSVLRRWDAAEGVVALELGLDNGQDLPAWTPGAHIDVHVGDQVRQFSLCGDPTDQATWRIGVLREPQGRGGSAYVHDVVAEGDILDVRGPRNNFEFVAAPNYLFIAGGIGITPLIPMMLAAQRASAHWELHYGGRSRRSMAFVDSLMELSATAVRVHPEDEVGLIDLKAILGEPRPDTVVYACGPEPLLLAVQETASEWSDPPRIERFSPKDLGDPEFSEAFEVELASSGMTLIVPPARSILEVVEEAGLAVYSSCHEGTCETAVISGEVDHRDSVLTPAEQAQNDVMFICVSRAACPRLVLEL